MRDFVDRFGGRKWTLALMVLVLGTGINFFGSLTPQLVNLYLGVLGVFVGGNAAAHLAHSRGNNDVEPDQPA